MPPVSRDLDRRTALVAAGAALVVGPSRPLTAAAVPAGVAALQALERRAGGRLGAFVLEPSGRSSFGWRADERFTHCSSFKLSLAAMVLAGADAGRIDLAEPLAWSKTDLLPASPVTSKIAEMRLPVEALAHAALTTSDNTAANALLRRFGGPAALTAFWRSIGDATSRLDRIEPALNVTPPGTELDTTTPAAMAGTVARLLLGDALKPGSRGKLRDWMIETKTGADRLRAGFPAAWASGDKTGTAVGTARDSYVDLAFGGAAGRTPLIVAAYFQPNRRTEDIDPAATAVLAEVGRIAAASFV